MSDQCATVIEEHLLLDSETLPGGFLRYYADGDEEIIHVNSYIVSLFECDSTQDFLDLTQGSFRHFVYADDLSSVEASIWGQVKHRENLDHVYYRVQTKTGKLVTVADYGRLVNDSPYGRPIFEVFIVLTSPQSTVDWLTGLSAMARFHELARMGYSMLMSMGQRAVAIAIDIMGMKEFNTRYGRREGDRLLCALADAMRAQFGGETCSRFGEDHFYAFAPEKDIEQKVRALFADFASADFERVPPLRVGLYSCNEQDDIVEVGFDRAKRACDLDRTTWQSHLSWYTDQMKEGAELRAHVLECLDRAITEGWIRPYYQPVMRSSTGKICEEEALARWVDPDFGVLAPDKFIPVLEDAALLHRLDLHIVDCVLRDFHKKRELGVPIVPVSVNISYRDLARFNVAQEIGSRADKAGVPHSLFHVEFTESAIQSDPVLFMEQVRALHEAGFEVWMDDFGSGYSSLNVLQRYEFDVIKLDMEFLRNSMKDIGKARSIVAGIVQTAKKLGVRTVCEGVETEVQAAFLERVGCDMLQGYHYSAPNPLSVVAQRVHDGVGLPRENREDELYWNTVSAQNLTDFSDYEGNQGIEGIAMSEFPAGVIERRHGSWYVLRDNKSFGEFLERVGVLQEGHSTLHINPVQNELDEEFTTACNRSTASQRWEQIVGRLEYGSGFQFYTRHIASAPDTDAFAVMGVPTMLGTALGAYGDVPVGYAVFRAILDDARENVVDAEYVYANDLYLKWTGMDNTDLTSRSFLDTVPNASDTWFPFCYRAAIKGEEMHDIIYSPEAGHWMSVHIAPSPIKDCCVYAFSLADDEHRKHQEMQMGLDTSDLIIRIARTLNGELDYKAGMDRTLQIMSEVIHPERIYIFECGETSVNNTFEWCAEGIEPQIDTLQDLDFSEFDTWNRLLSHEPIVFIPDVEDLRDTDSRMYWQLTRQGVTRLLAAPLYDGDHLLGYLGADNYTLEEDLDSVRALRSVASFVGARIANRRLMEKVQHMALHDDLTGLLNRKGADLFIANRMQRDADKPWALALMDIDDFKAVNDHLGHDLGDMGLCRIARAIERIFPDDTIIGRNGGDEFLVIVFGDEARNMDAYMAELMSLDFTCKCGEHQHEFTLSAGYVCHPEQVSNLRGAYTGADRALYLMKLSGKHGYQRFDPNA